MLFFIVYRLLDTREWSIKVSADGKLLTFATYEDAAEAGDSLIADFKHHGIPASFLVARLVDQP